MPRKAVSIKPTVDTQTWAAQLTPREHRFVSEYIIDLNATEAGVRAGLGKTRKSSTEIASRLRRKHAVAQAITVLIAQNSGATGSRIIEELGKLAFADVTGIVKVKAGQVIVTDTDELTADQRASIAEISETIGEGGRTIKVKLHDKLSALDKLAKVLSLYKEREAPRSEVPSNETVEAIRARITERLNKMRAIADERARAIPEIQPPMRRIEAPPTKAVRIIDAE
jgi:phage terminase small subunit